VATLRTTYLDDALTQFSGYLAIDEVYDGPFCIVSVVDNRHYNRLACCVLEHDPTHHDIRTFLADFETQLEQRGKCVRGITTDGSPLYPAVLEQLWPGVPHQLCEFHVLKEINQAVLHALAQIRKQIRANIPKLTRGRPRRSDRARTRRIKRQKEHVAELFEYRHLFVRHHLSAAQKTTLKRLTRGHRQLRVLRTIMDAVYRLFDRRCRMRTALARLAKLRTRVTRFKGLRRGLSKLFVPRLEKALVFLDDKLLGATSNAVERSNRRFRKAQQSIYSVRTQRHIEQRLALDMVREQHATKRAQTLQCLHRARSPRRWLKNRPLPRDEPQSTHSRC
jgi:transposase